METRLLYARGERATSVASRIVVEAGIPTAVGGLAGFGIALGLVRLFEPSSTIDAAGLWSAGEAAGIRLVAGLAMLGVVIGLWYRHGPADPMGARRWLARIPWEVLMLGVALIFFLDLHNGGPIESVDPAFAGPSLSVLLFPLLLVAGLALVAARLFRRLLQVALRPSMKMPTAAYLAIRRLTQARGLLVTFLVTAASAIGVLIYAQALILSLDHSTEIKARISVGTDVAVPMDYSEALPDRFPYPLTKVTKAYAAASLDSPVGRRADIMAIDPATFASAVRWDSSLDGSVDALISQLGRDPHKPLPIILAGDRQSAEALYFGQEAIPIITVAKVRTFPGMTARHPLIVTSYSSLDAVVQGAGLADPIRYGRTMAWARGPTQDVINALRASTLRPFSIQTIRELLERGDVVRTRQSYSLLRALGVGAGAVALVGLLFYLQARHRKEVVSALLLERMGFCRGAQALALSLEVGALLLLATGIATGAVLAVVPMIVVEVDPLPHLPPPPVFDPPFGIISLVASTAVTAAALIGVLGSYALAHGDKNEAIRHGP